MPRGRLIVAIFILFLLLAVIVIVLPRETGTSVRLSSHPDVPLYALRGPHLVGIRDLAIQGEPPQDITVWYPALDSDNLGTAIRYPFEIEIGFLLDKITIATNQGLAMNDAPYDYSEEPYPLVILSPGFSIGRTSYAWLVEHLASHGFVVIATGHREEGLATASSELWRATITRPQDLLTLLAYIDEQVDEEGIFDGMIDTDLVAVIGHSLGGYAALSAVGARLDTDGFEDRCKTAYKANDPNVWLCDILLSHVSDMAKLAGLDSNTGLWPAVADPRVGAIVSMAGDAYLFDEAGLAEITVPVMAIGGTGDRDTPYLWGTHPTYDYVSSPTKARVALIDTEHMIFTSPCDRISRLNGIIFDAFCSDPNWDKGHAHDLINHLMTAFLLTELKDDIDAAAALMPDKVEFPDLTYEAQGY